MGNRRDWPKMWGPAPRNGVPPAWPSFMPGKRPVAHIKLTRRWPSRYFAGLSKPMKLKREKELLKRRRVPYSKLKLGASNKAGTKRKSRWTMQFHRVYPGLKFNKEAIARRTGISRSTLNTVYNRGLKAWKTGGSRPGATAQQWAIARLYKFVLISKHKAPRAWFERRYDPNANLRR